MKKSLVLLLVLGLICIMHAESLTIESFASPEMGNSNAITQFNDTYWVATDQGLVRVVSTSSSISGISHYDTDNGLLNNKITSFTNFNGRLWIGSHGGVNVMESNINSLSYLTCSDGLCCDSINAVSSIDNAVWIGSCNGVTIMNRSNDIPIRSYTIDTLNTSNGLLSDNIQALKVGRMFSKNVGFIGTSAGLNYSYKDFGSYMCRSISTAEGLTSNDIRDIEVSGQNVWLATSSGVSVIRFSTDFDTYTISEYNTSDGLPTNNIRSVAAGMDNTYWFGTDAGVVKLKFLSVPVRSDAQPVFRSYTTDDGLLSNNIGSITYIDRKLLVASDSGFNVMDFNPIAIDDEMISITEKVSIVNFPNPFNPNTEISYSIPSSGHTEVTIFNIKGQVVKKLVNEYKPSGIHTINWNGKNAANRNVSSGLYFCRIAHAEGTDMTKMSLLK